MRLHIVRHADPDYENDTITPAGHLEAAALARRFATQGLDRLYASPLPRAAITARYTSDLLKLPVETLEWAAEPRLRCDVTPWGRVAVWDIPGEVIRGGERMPSHDDCLDLEHLAGSGAGEHFAVFREHSDGFLAGLGYRREGGRYRILRSHRERVAVFCHNGAALFWLAHLLEIPLTLAFSGFWHAPSSVTTVLLDERSEQWAVPRCLAVGDVSHLYEARLPVQPRGIITNYH
ncbi:MAG TPA: histidine phosphatase family protein [Deinococcales bacterium]|nr:histidine phosphatase family protein [Deinococcales bacterium]